MVKTYGMFESHYVLCVPIISPSTLPGSSALNKKHTFHENIYVCVSCFCSSSLIPTTTTTTTTTTYCESTIYHQKKQQCYWDPVYMSQNFEFAGAAPPGVGETWELVWKGRVEMSFTWGCCNGITYPDGMTFSGWVQTLDAVFLFFFWGGGTSGKILFVASYYLGKSHVRTMWPDLCWWSMPIATRVTMFCHCSFPSCLFRIWRCLLWAKFP